MHQPQILIAGLGPQVKLIHSVPSYPETPHYQVAMCTADRTMHSRHEDISFLQRIYWGDFHA